MVAPLTQPIPKKSSLLAFILAFVFGPLGFLYLGWRYGLAAIGSFVVYVGTLAIPSVGIWLAMAAPPVVWAIVHCVVVGISTAIIVQERNGAIDRGDAITFEESKGMELAVTTT